MATPKRARDDLSSEPKNKRVKFSKPEQDKIDTPLQSTSNLSRVEVDFPRGGGTSFTPLEVKTIRAEAVKEANDEMFKVSRLHGIVRWYVNILVIGYIGIYKAKKEEKEIGCGSAQTIGEKRQSQNRAPQLQGKLFAIRF
jgi:hypothetical protein